jgi:hypothetical protein
MQDRPPQKSVPYRHGDVPGSIIPMVVARSWKPEPQPETP